MINYSSKFSAQVVFSSLQLRRFQQRLNNYCFSFYVTFESRALISFKRTPQFVSIFIWKSSLHDTLYKAVSILSNIFILRYSSKSNYISLNGCDTTVTISRKNKIIRNFSREAIILKFYCYWRLLGLYRTNFLFNNWLSDLRELTCSVLTR